MIRKILSVIIAVMICFVSFVLADDMPELKLFDDTDTVNTDKALLTIESLLRAPLANGCLIDSLNLPLKGAGGSDISWQSSDTAVISDSGLVTRPFDNDKTVTMTATFVSGEKSTTENYTFTVASYQTSVEGMPKLMGRVYHDEFDDDNPSSDHLLSNASAGSITEENGKLKLTRLNSSGNSFVRLFTTNSRTNEISENVFTEYDISREAQKTVLIRAYDVKERCIASLDWNAEGYIQYYNKDTDGWDKAAGDELSKNKFKLSLLTNPETQTYSVWMNNKLILDSQKMRSNGVTGLCYVQIYMEGSNTTTVNIDSYSVYNIWKDISDEERVNADFEALTKDSILSKPEAGGMTDSDLILPSNGAFGSIITWTSSDPSVVGTDGKIYRPDDDVGHNVTVTAEIQSGSVQKEKSFDLIIPGVLLEITDEMTVKNMVCEENFEDPKHMNVRMAHEPSDATGTYEIKNGKYNVTRADNSLPLTYIRMYVGDGQIENALEGVIGVEFTVSRDAEKAVEIRINDRAQANFLSITWTNSGNIIIAHADTPTGSSYWDNMNVSFPKELKVKILLDCRRSLATVWINDKLMKADMYSRTAGITNYLFTQIYSEKSDYFTFSVDDYKVYEAMPPSLSRLDYDSFSLTQKSILTKDPVMDNFIDADLNLYTSMDFGTKIKWESSNPAIIDPDTGIITRPDASEHDETVTLTAHMRNCTREETKQFDFVVLRGTKTTDEAEKADYDTLSEALITRQNPTEIKESLNLMSTGVYGSSISWQSSDVSVLMPSGRVKRPRWNHNDVKVTVTATVADKYTKSFEFIVKADEKPTDKQKLKDEAFFGTYLGDKWTIKPLLNYEYEGMEKVGEAAKTGDYTLAKEELLKHMKERTKKSSVSLSPRKTGWVDSILAGMSDMQSDAYYAAASQVDSCEYDKITVHIANPKVTNAVSKTFRLMSKYNDPVEIIIAGKNCENENMRPRFVLYVNGTARTYEASHAATVRTGEYTDTPLGGTSELSVKMFGEFLGNETYNTLIQFDFDDITENDTVEYGELVFYAKKSNSYSEPKEFYVMRDSNSNWDDETVTWNSLKSYVHNYSGLDGELTWENVLHSDVEYAYQCCRFYGYREMMSEYLYTRNEDYAYCVLKRMMDFINDKTYGWPRTLDTAVRMEAWAGIFNYLVDLDYMDPDICAAIIKEMYQSSVLCLMPSSATTANWIQTEKMNAYHVMNLFPEFAESDDIKSEIQNIYSEMIFNDYYDDGAYIEDTTGYNTGALSQYITIRKFITESGGTVSPEFDEIIKKGAYWNLLMFAPGGTPTAYGDGGPGSSSLTTRYQQLVDWYGDYELQYIDTYGTKGIEPSWTSRLYPTSSYAFMRSDWSNKAHYLFTNVRGGGTHGHYDDNSLIIFAYGRNLICDAGYVSYSGGDERALAMSTLNHNTIEINGENQQSPKTYTLKFDNIGETTAWTANKNFDFLSQRTKGYDKIGNSHKRTTTFIKPDFWIVSDYCSPTDKTEINKYKQTWHMLPNSNLKYDDKTKKVWSEFETGANIIAAGADSDAAVSEGTGIYTATYGQGVSAPYGCYEKNAAGDVTFDTVLFPYEGRGSISVERIELDVPTTSATALKINTDKNGVVETTYYVLNYTDETQRTFDKYAADGQMAVIRESKAGNITEIVLNNGNMVTTKDGIVLLDTDENVKDISAELVNGTLRIESSDENIDLSKIRINFLQNINEVYVNGKYKKFYLDGNTVTISGETANEVVKNDKNSQTGIVDRDSSGGGTAPGGDIIPLLPFTDIENHWAKDYIIKASKKSLLKGYEDKTFRPDSNITRAEFTSLVCRAFVIESKNYNGEFSDVSESEWYAESVASAVHAGIVSYDTFFRPQDNITREEICKILACAIKLTSDDEVSEDFELSYTDKDSISEWAKKYVKYLSFKKYITGRSDGRFDGASTATRAEAATVLSKILGL